MNVVKKRTVVERVDSYWIQDGEVREVPHSRSGRLYRVDRAEVRTVREDGMVDRLTYTLFGQVLKKDGSDGLNRTDERFLWNADAAPKWLTSLHAEQTAEHDTNGADK